MGFYHKNKEHIFSAILILLLVLVVFNKFIRTDDLPARDIVVGYYPTIKFVEQSISKYGDFSPLWNPYIMSGTPFPLTSGYDLIVLFLSKLLPNIQSGLKALYIIDFFLAGLFMYFLVIYLGYKPKYAFISAIIFVFNSWLMVRLRNFHLGTINGYMLMPLIMIFIIKAVKEKDFVKYSIITGLLFAIQLRLNPDLKAFIFTGLMFGLYLIFSLIGNNLKNRVLKTSAIALLVGLIIFGLDAQIILFNKEVLDMSPRANLNYEDSASRSIKVKDLFDKIIGPVNGGFLKPHIGYRPGENYQIGIFAFMLALFAIFFRIKNKPVIFFSLIAIFSLFLVTGSFVYFLLWKFVPPFSSFRYLDRTLILFVFSTSILAGIGASVLFKKIENKLSKSALNAAYLLLVAIIVLDLAVFGYYPYNDRILKDYDLDKAIENNYILNYISNQKGIFRIQTYETNGIDHASDHYNVALGLEHIYGYIQTWNPIYFNTFLNFAHTNPAKFWGILNVKYITSTTQLNVTGFRFIKEFDKCNVCFNDRKEWNKHYGPYLYENEEFVPRLYIAQNSILIIGDKNENFNSPPISILYGVLSDVSFNNKNTAVVLGQKGSIKEYDSNFLNKFNVIFLTPGSMDQNSLSKLKLFKEKGGIIIPDSAVEIDYIMVNAQQIYILLSFSIFEKTHFEGKVCSCTTSFKRNFQGSFSSINLVEFHISFVRNAYVLVETYPTALMP